MTTPSTFIRYSLRNRLFVLAGATFLLCALVILLFFPLLNLTLTGLQDRTLKSMQEGQEVEATTIARLLVMEFSSLKGLMQVTPTSDTDVDKWIKDMLWLKVTFNEIIEGIELIQAQPDVMGRHLTYLFYRREAPELKPMDGPQKIMKAFEGLEQDLIYSINEQQRVDNALQDSVNRGPKQEGMMLLRYMPVYVLLADEGAVYWGVAKIGIDTSRVRQLLLLQSEEQNRIRNAIWIEIILSLLISGLLAMSLIYFWVRYITEPLKNLSVVAADLQTADPKEFELWLENLKRVDAQGQAELVVIQQVLERLGTAVPRLGQRLIDGEAWACLGKVMARGLPAFQAWQAQLQALEQESGGRGEAGSSHQTRALMQARMDSVLDDLSHLWSDPKEEWDRIDLTPGLQRVWRLATLGTPPGVMLHLDLPPLPPVWGSAAELSLAALYLLIFAADLLPPDGDLGLTAEPTPSGGVRLTVWVSGGPWTPEACQAWLNPFAGPGRIEGSLGPALAGAIAAQHGGSLEAAPLESGGAAFSLELPPPPRPRNPMNLLSKTARALLQLAMGGWDQFRTLQSRVLNFCALFYRLLLGLFNGPFCPRLLFQEMSRQVYYTAIQGSYILVFTALMLGMLVIVHATQQLVKVQGEEFIGWLLVTIVVREVGPVWAAFFVLLHSGGAITVEIGTMSVNREVQALQMMGIDPYRYLGVPRFWGLTFSLISLYILCVFAGIIGGYLFAQAFAEIFWAKFWLSFINALQWVDLSLGFAKTTIFAMVIATVSIYFGFQSQDHMGEVAQNTSRAAIWSLVLIGVVDIIMTSAYYL